jgi:hypothetical protein
LRAVKSLVAIWQPAAASAIVIVAIVAYACTSATPAEHRRAKRENKDDHAFDVHSSPASIAPASSSSSHCNKMQSGFNVQQ